jgi:hypothetical protein
MTDDSPRRAALRYLERGWSVVPIRPRDKRPLGLWHAYEEHRASRAEVDGWYRDHPDAGVGIVTGSVSGIVVLDVDPAHGGDDSLAELERVHGPLPETVEAITGSGGRHLYFRHPGGVIPNRAGLAPGIDLRGDGGLVVAPPSVHPSGKRYFWEVSHHPDDVALAAMPLWLRDRISSPGHPRAYWRSLVQEGIAEGARNNTIASLAGHLLRHGVDATVALELLLCWNRVKCRPPLSDEEVARVVESIRRLHEREIESER